MKFLKYFKTELFYQEIAWFAAAQFLGIFLIDKVSRLLAEIEQPAGEIKLSEFFIYFLIITIIVVFIPRRSRISAFLMRSFFIFVLFYGANLFLSLFINSESAFFFAAALVVARFVFPLIFLHNVAFLLSIVAFSSFFSLQLSQTAIVILLAILAVYDVVAVYLTGHMVKMAKSMIESKVIFGFIIPEKIKYNFLGVEKAKPGEGIVFLGGGDIGLPLLLVANAAHTDIVQGAILAIFAILGMAFSYWLFISQKFRKPMPALPPISMMTIIGYLLIKIIWG